MRYCGKAPLLIALLAFAFPLPGAGAEQLPPRTASPLDVMQIHSGHSLTDSYMAWPAPGRLVLATKLRSRVNPHDTIAKSTIPGSPMSWRWTHASGTPDAKAEIGNYELLVTTESVPLRVGPASFKRGTLDWIDKWIDHAWKQGNSGQGAEVMLYSTWVSWQNGKGDEADIPFRKRLDIDGGRWEQMQDHANAIRPAGMPPIYMIPGHRMMMRIYDDIEASRAPEMTHISDVFKDDIHPNAAGQYAIACLVYAVIYQRDPRELPNKLAREHDTFTSSQAQYFKTIAWEIATGYDRTGFRADQVQGRRQGALSQPKTEQ